MARQHEHIRQAVKVCEEALAAIDGQREIIKAALEFAQETHGLDAGAVRRLLRWRRQRDKDPTKRAFDDELDDQYRFMCEGGSMLDMPEKADSEVDRVMALCGDGKPPRIDAIKKAIGCSQGKAQKLRSLAVARLAVQSSSSPKNNEREPITETALDVPGEGAAIRPEIGSGSLATSFEAGNSAQGERDAPVDPRVHEADRGADRADGSSPGGGEGLQRRAGCGTAGGAGQDVHDPQPPNDRDVGERGDHAAAGRDAPDLADAGRGVDAPSTPPLGAVAEPSAAQRVARPEQDQAVDLNDIPSFLRRQASR